MFRWGTLRSEHGPAFPRRISAATRPRSPFVIPQHALSAPNCMLTYHFRRSWTHCRRRKREEAHRTTLGKQDFPRIPRDSHPRSRVETRRELDVALLDIAAGRATGADRVALHFCGSPVTAACGGMTESPARRRPRVIWDGTVGTAGPLMAVMFIFGFVDQKSSLFDVRTASSLLLGGLWMVIDRDLAADPVRLAGAGDRRERVAAGDRSLGRVRVRVVG